MKTFNDAGKFWEWRWPGQERTEISSYLLFKCFENLVLPLDPVLIKLFGPLKVSHWWIVANPFRCNSISLQVASFVNHGVLVPEATIIGVQFRY